ncbi:MAG: hypothetical protein EOP48_01725 [Sphingobacteriales bacterium]|nr:MAG: hypothetical protein EOP48_01725 [Sphingobacteriales bacterium]
MFPGKQLTLSFIAVLLFATSIARGASKINSETDLESSPSSIKVLQLSGTLENDENDDQVRIYPRNSNQAAYFIVRFEDISSIKNILGKEFEVDSLTVESIGKNNTYYIDIKDNSEGQGIELDENGNIEKRTKITMNKTYPLSFLMKAYPLEFPISNALKQTTQRIVNCHFSSVCVSQKVCCSSNGNCQCWTL